MGLCVDKNTPNSILGFPGSTKPVGENWHHYPHFLDILTIDNAL